VSGGVVAEALKRLTNRKRGARLNEQHGWTKKHNTAQHNTGSGVECIKSE
jgi:hypothetical protein